MSTATCFSKSTTPCILKKENKSAIKKNFNENICVFKKKIQLKLEDKRINVIDKEDRITFKFFKSYKDITYDQLLEIVESLLSKYNLKTSDVFNIKRDITDPNIYHFIYK